MAGQIWKAFRTVSSISAVMALMLGVCPAQILPPSPEMAAKVVSLTGQVSILHDSQPWALNVGDKVQAKQVIISGPDGYALFEVSDGSTFEVYPNSTVVFRNNPPTWRDLLDVLVGRVKVHIQKWGGQPNPNRIHTPSAVISVRGTTFDVSVDSEDESTLIAVEEGQVDVRHALKGDTRIVNAGESLQVYKNQPLAYRSIDKGAVAQRLLRAVTDALYTMQTSGSRVPGVKVPGAPGNTTPIPPPPPPPPTPPPPPPH
jgi:hypothetical protein